MNLSNSKFSILSKRNRKTNKDCSYFPLEIFALCDVVPTDVQHEKTHLISFKEVGGWNYYTIAESFLKCVVVYHHGHVAMVAVKSSIPATTSHSCRQPPKTASEDRHWCSSSSSLFACDSSSSVVKFEQESSFFSTQFQCWHISYLVQTWLTTATLATILHCNNFFDCTFHSLPCVVCNEFTF